MSIAPAFHMRVKEAARRKPLRRGSHGVSMALPAATLHLTLIFSSETSFHLEDCTSSSTESSIYAEPKRKLPLRRLSSRCPGHQSKISAFRTEYNVLHFCSFSCNWSGVLIEDFTWKTSMPAAMPLQLVRIWTPACCCPFRVRGFSQEPFFFSAIGKK